MAGKEAGGGTAPDRSARRGSSGEGRIVVVGTPLGNLGDMAPRATETLAAADRIACEDTRRTGRLLQHLGVAAPRLVRLDDHTEDAVSADLVGAAIGGELVAVVTDAGMPALSDPGGRLVAAAVEAGVRLEVVPGPFAGALAAVGSGLLDPSGRFVFEGFLPRKGAERLSRLRVVAGERRPVVLYESPHRLPATVDDLVDACGPDRAVALCRELTKLHEETWRGTLGEAVGHLAGHTPRGEFVVVLDGAPPPADPTDDEVSAALDARVAAGASRRDAAAEVAAELGVPPNRAKRLANRR